MCLLMVRLKYCQNDFSYMVCIMGFLLTHMLLVKKLDLYCFMSQGQQHPYLSTCCRLNVGVSSSILKWACPTLTLQKTTNSNSEGKRTILTYSKISITSYTYIHKYIHTYIHTYIYIYIERERERERELCFSIITHIRKGCY